MNTKIMSAVFLVQLIAGCTVEAKLDEPEARTIQCKGLGGRDSFSFRTDQVISVRQGFGTPSVLTLVDTDGRKRVLNSEQEKGWDCK